jgi:hypothetical protein
VIAAWARGDQQTATEQFMAIDWMQVSDSRSLFGLTEKEFAALPEADRNTRVADVMARLNDLRALSRHVVEEGKKAVSAGDGGKARRSFQAVAGCGKWLMKDPNAMAIVKNIGKAIDDLGSRQLQAMKP